MKIFLIIALTTFTTLLEAGLLEEFGKRHCNGPYDDLLKDQKKAVKYQNLSSRSKEQLDASFRKNLDECLDQCQGEKFYYCDKIQKKLEVADQKHRQEVLKKYEEENSFSHSLKNILK